MNVDKSRLGLPDPRLAMWTLASGPLDAPTWDLEFGVKAVKVQGKLGIGCSGSQGCSGAPLRVVEAGVL